MEQSKNKNTGPRLYGLHARGKPRPHTWKCGPDEYKHSMYWPWQKMRAQAVFRGEEFTLEFEDFYNLWKDDWDNRGRKATNMCLTRREPNGVWSKENTILITRQEHLERQGFYRQHNGKTRVQRGKGKKNERN